MSRFTATYHVRSDARSIEARAEAIAVERSVEMPLSAIEDQRILDEIVGKVEEVRDIGNGAFAVRIALSADTAGSDAGQLINMLFGNTSLQEDVVLHDAEFPDDVVAPFGGPNVGLDGLRARAGAAGRAWGLRRQGSHAWYADRDCAPPRSRAENRRSGTRCRRAAA